jgi:hypothetical protein
VLQSQTDSDADGALVDQGCLRRICHLFTDAGADQKAAEDVNFACAVRKRNENSTIVLRPRFVGCPEVFYSVSCRFQSCRDHQYFQKHRSNMTLDLVLRPVSSKTL